MSWKSRARALTGARPFVAPVLDLCRPTRVPATPDGDGWVHELKRDGYRMTAIVRDRTVRLVSRQGRDWTDRMRGVAERVRTLGFRDGQLDGEVIAVDAQGRDDFNALQRAMYEGAAAPLAFVAFDVMSVAGIDVTQVPLLERKALLRELVDGSPVAYSTHLEERGSVVFDEVASAGFEGVVSKRADSPYASGTSRTWLKSMARLQDDFVAIGWMAPEGRSHGGLMIARVDGGALAYSGIVAAGVAGEKLVQLRARLAPQRGPTISHPELERRAHRIEWATPTVAVRVAMRGWTDDGMLRHPSLVAVLAA